MAQLLQTKQVKQEASGPALPSPLEVGSRNPSGWSVKRCLYALSGVRGGAPADRQWIIRYFEPIGNVSEAVDVYNILGDISSSVPSTSRFEGLDAPPPVPPKSPAMWSRSGNAGNIRKTKEL